MTTLKLITEPFDIFLTELTAETDSARQAREMAEGFRKIDYRDEDLLRFQALAKKS